MLPANNGQTQILNVDTGAGAQLLEADANGNLSLVADLPVQNPPGALLGMRHIFKSWRWP
jgi:hypothetical protein